MENFDIYDDELRYSRYDEIEKNYSLREELRTYYDKVFNYDELTKYMVDDRILIEVFHNFAKQKPIAFLRNESDLLSFLFTEENLC